MLRLFNVAYADPAGFRSNRRKNMDECVARLVLKSNLPGRRYQRWYLRGKSWWRFSRNSPILFRFLGNFGATKPALNTLSRGPSWRNWLPLIESRFVFLTIFKLITTVIDGFYFSPVMQLLAALLFFDTHTFLSGEWAVLPGCGVIARIYIYSVKHPRTYA